MKEKTVINKIVENVINGIDEITFKPLEKAVYKILNIKPKYGLFDEEFSKTAASKLNKIRNHNFNGIETGPYICQGVSIRRSDLIDYKEHTKKKIITMLETVLEQDLPLKDPVEPMLTVNDSCFATQNKIQIGLQLQTKADKE